MRRAPDPETARSFIRDAGFLWHQRFELAPGVLTPGSNDIDHLLGLAGLPQELDGASVLDIGTTNGGLAFALERRGAGRVVAVDLYRPEWFGFDQIRELVGSSAEYVRASVYELPTKLGERFDIVAFLGVLYHLRHPMLGLDAVRALTRGQALIETAICDHALPAGPQPPLALFHRLDGLAGDSSNWFEPSAAGLEEWCRSSGLEPIRVERWPAETPSRCLLVAEPIAGDPEYIGLSYEMPLRCSSSPADHLPGDSPEARAYYDATVRAGSRARTR